MAPKATGPLKVADRVPTPFPDAATPLPARVVTRPVGEMARTLLLDVSATYKVKEGVS
jgi:hypothetical protein